MLDKKLKLKLYIFFIRSSVRPSVGMNAKISETLKATKLGLSMQILEIPTQHKSVNGILFRLE